MTNKRMVKSGIVLGIMSCLLATIFPPSAQGAQKYFLVKNGQAQGVIIAPAQQSDAATRAIDELQYHIKRAANVTLKIVDENQAKSVPADWVRISFNEDGKLPVESFGVKSQNNQLVFTGDDKTADTLTWAVDHYLDVEWGVRWLWPGDVGTYVPQRSDIVLSDINVIKRPFLELRQLRIGLESAHNMKNPRHSPVILLNETQYKKELDEANDWLRRFQIGSRSHYKFGHSFTKWWDRYGKDHPDYFAVPPKGSKYKQPSPQPSRVKLNLSNTAVDDQIIAEWKAAGAPDNWNVCPNDSAGFDTSPGTMAMDDPPNQDPDAVWKGRANLTARYVKFWNRLIPKMRAINPNVSLSSYAYSAYRWTPINGLKLESNIVLGFVPSFEDAAKEDWNGWQQAGAKLFLRPNWWHMARVSPNLPLHKQGNFFKFGLSHNMVGFDSDSLVGDWGVQSPLYYTISRLMVHPEMSVDDIINEYSSAFGNAAPDIKAYLKYWEDYSTKVGFAYPNPVPGGLLDKVVKEHGLRNSYLNQSWQVMPYIYTDDVLNKGYAILDQADKNAKSNNNFVKERIQFLRDGLNHLKLTRDVSALGESLSISSTSNDIERYKNLSAQLEEMRKEMTQRNVVWGESLYAAENTRGAPTIVNKILDKADPVRKYIKSRYTVGHSLPLTENWVFKTDAENSGEKLGFAQSKLDDSSWKSINSLNWWQRQGIDYYGTAWYRVKFQGKTLAEGESAQIYFGPVDGNAVIYLNGKQIGKHLLGENFAGWDKAFTVNATKQLLPGENVLVVKVTSKSNDTASGMTGGAALITGTRK